MEPHVVLMIGVVVVSGIWFYVWAHYNRDSFSIKFGTKAEPPAKTEARLMLKPHYCPNCRHRLLAMEGHGVCPTCVDTTGRPLIFGGRPIATCGGLRFFAGSDGRNRAVAVLPKHVPFHE